MATVRLACTRCSRSTILPSTVMTPLLAFSGYSYLGGVAGHDASGTATLELIVVTPECVLGRIGEVVQGPDQFIDQELPGGFLAGRNTL